MAQCNCGTCGNFCGDYRFKIFTTHVSPVSLRNENPVPLGEGGGGKVYFIFFFLVKQVKQDEGGREGQGVGATPGWLGPGIGAEECFPL